MGSVYSSRITKIKKKVPSLFEGAFGVKVVVVFTSFKVKSYFQLKSRTHNFLCWNVVYKFQCLCNANVSYIGMTSWHLCTRAGEHLDLNKKGDSVVKQHRLSCPECLEETRDFDSKRLKIIKQCQNEYETKINEAFITRKVNPKLNVQQYNNGASLLLNVF